MTNSSTKALDAFLSAKAEIDNMLAKLQSASENNFGIAPDAIHWGHVGDLQRYASLLRRLTV